MAVTLFQVETDKVLLQVTSREKPEDINTRYTPASGKLLFTSARRGIEFIAENCRRYGDPSSKVFVESDEHGPMLFEQKDYYIYAESMVPGESVRISHRDPTIEDCFTYPSARKGSVCQGTVNFGSDVGMSRFSIAVGSVPEFDFQVEVFPSKLDYKEDYSRLIQDLRRLLSGLVLEYLRTTFTIGDFKEVPDTEQLEWLVLLKHVAIELEKALRHVAERPQWGLQSNPIQVNAARIKHIDSSVRKTILKGKGKGDFSSIGAGVSVRERIVEEKARVTLDTPEHRWLRCQLSRIRRRLIHLGKTEERLQSNSLWGVSSKGSRALEEIEDLLKLINRLRNIAPLAEAEEVTVPGFASLKLLQTPGYREAYKACLLLNMGLSLLGDVVELSLKEIHVLYEYWCYLKLVERVTELTDVKEKDLNSIFSIEQEGIRVRLTQGRKQTIPLKLSDGRKITISYNQSFSRSMLVSQKPDMVITIERPHWPSVRLLLDAKYRLDQSDYYRKSYGAPGPPEDAINVLHRYRDAILEEDSSKNLTRSVIQGAAVYPYHEENGEFGKSRLWSSLERLGIGAIPLLPEETKYLDKWLDKMLRRGGWSVADTVIPHSTTESSRDWKQAETEFVRIGLLKGGMEKEHLSWIEENRLYYVPMLGKQPRQYQAKWLALYSPVVLRQPGAITHVARIVSIDVQPRNSIKTPWESHQENDESLQIVYRLDELKEMENPIINRIAEGDLPGMPYRWTTRLGLRRASILRDVLLETEAEWRLREELEAAGVDYKIRAGRVGPDSAGRASFILDDLRITYWGMEGFKVEDGKRTLFTKRILFESLNSDKTRQLDEQYGDDGWIAWEVSTRGSTSSTHAIMNF